MLLYISDIKVFEVYFLRLRFLALALLISAIISCISRTSSLLIGESSLSKSSK